MPSQQTAELTFRVPDISDATVARVMAEIIQLDPKGEASFSVSIAQANSTNLYAAQDVEKIIGESEWKKSRVVKSAYCAIGDPVLNITFRRGTTHWDQGHHGRHEPSGWESEFFFTWRDQTNPDPNLRRAVSLLISRVARDPTNRAPANDFEKAMAAQVAKMAELQANILEDAADSRRKMEDEFSRKKAELDGEIASLRKAVREEAALERQRLSQEAAALDLRAKELDDRGHMHARRQLRAEITKALKDRLERPGVSRQAYLLRMTVAGLSISGIIGFAAVASFALPDLHQAYSSSTPNLYVLAFSSVRFAIPVTAAAGLLFYMLGWLRKLHAEDVRSERDLERYRYDLDRASWAIETILEAQGKENANVPLEWTTGVTHGLFTRSAAGNEDREAADALGSLLNFAAKAEFGPNGPKLEFSKRDLRRLSREASAETSV